MRRLAHGMRRSIRRSMRRGILRGLAAAAVLGTLAAAPAAAQGFKDIDAAVRRGIQRHTYPGAVVVIGRRDTILYARGYGHLTWSPKSAVPRADSTLWDLASITKVLGTASTVLRLVDRGAVDLDAPVARYLPGFDGGAKDSVTVRMLLDHTSGLRSYLPLFRLTRNRAAATETVLNEPLSRAPGDSPVYSDLNAILLGFLVERVTGLSLDSAVQREVLGPLGLRQTRYRPPPAWRRRAAPTSVGPRDIRQGVVNDLNASRLGGVAGHAGLFSTGKDVARFAQAWLKMGDVTGGQWVRRETMLRFLERGPRSGTRALGWDTPGVDDGGPSIFGSLVSGAAYGHTGWTGTEVWIDPVNDLFLVFLTNRSYEPRTRRTFEQLRVTRAEVSEAAARLVPRGCAQELVATC